MSPELKAQIRRIIEGYPKGKRFDAHLVIEDLKADNLYFIEKADTPSNNWHSQISKEIRSLEDSLIELVEVSGSYSRNESGTASNNTIWIKK